MTDRSSSLSIIERAIELARDGLCDSVNEIQRVLTREQYEQVQAHLAGKAIRAKLQSLLNARRRGFGEDTQVPTPNETSNQKPALDERRRWTSDEDRRLRELRADGVKTPALAVALGRSRSAVITRLSLLGIRLPAT